MANGILKISVPLSLCVKKQIRLLGVWLALSCAAAEPAHVPMEWKCVQTNAIAAWKSANAAPDGIVADAASRSVRFLAEATGLEDATTVEFLAIGPLSDRAYESLFVTVPSPAAIASALERVGVPRGVPPDIAGARLWPCGEKLTLSAKRLKPDAPSPRAACACRSPQRHRREGRGRNPALAVPLHRRTARRSRRRSRRHEHPLRRVRALQPLAVAASA